MKVYGRGDADLERRIEVLTERVKDLELINETHQKLNAELRKDSWKLKEKESELIKAINMIEGLKKVVTDLTTQLYKK